MDRATRAREFLHSLDELASTRIEDLEYGIAYFNDDLPLVQERTNFVRVSSWLDAAKLAGLIQETESAQQKAGLKHRKLVFEEARTDKLAPFLRAMRWDVSPATLLVHDGRETWAAPPGHGITTMEGDRARDMLGLQLDLESRGRYPKTVEERVKLDDILGESITIRRWAAWAGQEPMAVCSMYSNGRVAQLTGLHTFEEYRRKRHGYAVLAAALQAASAEHDLVFGIADTGGWNEAWFTRMGFQQVAERAVAVRTVGATATRV